MTPDINRMKAAWIFDGAMQDLGGVVPNSTQVYINRHGNDLEIEFSLRLRPEDLDTFLRNLGRNGEHIKTVIDLYGPPRYARSTTDGRRSQ